jgi:hypothetical protein
METLVGANDKSEISIQQGGSKILDPGKWEGCTDDAEILLKFAKFSSNSLFITIE